MVTRILSPLTVEIQRSAKSRPKKVHRDKLKDFVGSPPRDWRSPSSGTTADENEVSDTRFATVEASSGSVAWLASTAKDAGEKGKELEGNVGAQSEGIVRNFPSAAVSALTFGERPRQAADVAHLLAGSQHKCSVGRADALKACLRCVGFFHWKD